METPSNNQCVVCSGRENLYQIDGVTFCDTHSKCGTCKQSCAEIGTYWSCACYDYVTLHEDVIYCSERCMDVDHEGPEGDSLEEGQDEQAT